MRAREKNKFFKLLWKKRIIFHEKNHRIPVSEKKSINIKIEIILPGSLEPKKKIRVGKNCTILYWVQCNPHLFSIRNIIKEKKTKVRNKIDKKMTSFR